MQVDSRVKYIKHNSKEATTKDINNKPKVKSRIHDILNKQQIGKGTRPPAQD